MAWNEPNDKNKKKDSWSGNEQSPPDLDEALKRFQKKLRGAIGGGNRGGSNTGTDGNGGMGLLFALVATRLSVCSSRMERKFFTLNSISMRTG